MEIHRFGWTASLLVTLGVLVGCSSSTDSQQPPNVATMDDATTDGDATQTRTDDKASTDAIDETTDGTTATDDTADDDTAEATDANTVAAADVEVKSVDRAGLEEVIDSHAGKVVLVDFWFTL